MTVRGPREVPIRERRRTPTPQYDSGRAPYSMLLGLSAFLLVGALSFRQMSSPPVAHQLIAEGVAALTEVDSVLSEHLEEMRNRAATARDGDLVALPGYPLPVRFTRDEALRLTPAEVREVLLERSAAIVYDEGLSAFNQTGGGSLSLFSSQGALDRLVRLLSDRNRTFADVASVVFGLLTAVGGVMVGLRSTGLSRVRALGVPLLGAAAVGIVVFGGLLALALGRWWGGDPFSDRVDAIIGDAIGIFRRNYFILGALGLALVVGGLLFELAGRLLLRRGRDLVIGDEL
jgi:hypothetical protein